MRNHPRSVAQPTKAKILVRSQQAAAVITVSAIAAIAFVMLFPTTSHASTPGNQLVAPKTGGFPDPGLSNWSERALAGNTTYEMVPAGDTQVLKGEADGTASILYKQQKISLDGSPWVNWSWRVENTLGPIDEKTKSGDDFPARLYVVVQTGFLPWETMAVNYVWSSTSDADTHWPSPFTEKSIMVAVRSGEDGLGEWHHEKRNVVEDFKTFFNADITELDGYAVMVDADNSGKKATAYFGNIEFTTH